MVKTRHAIPALFLLAGCTAVLGIDKDYVLVAGDGGSARDAGEGDARVVDSGNDSDAGVLDAGCVGGHVCDGVCLPGSSCASCAVGQLLCTATRVCVGGCAACAGSAIECFRCADGGAASAEGSCEPAATAYCLGGTYAHCPCNIASNCPGGNQTCRSKDCVSCGETASDGARCKNGLTCEETKKLCN